MREPRLTFSSHFPELQKKSDGQLHLMVHTGSRYLGQLIKEYYIKHIADMENNKLYALEADSELGQQYFNDHNLALRYACENRKEILRRALQVIKDFLQLDDSFVAQQLQQVVDIPHNFISNENHFGEQVFVHRKGAQNRDYSILRMCMRWDFLSMRR